jgi:hypothetical protein
VAKKKTRHQRGRKGLPLAVVDGTMKITNKRKNSTGGNSMLQCKMLSSLTKVFADQEPVGEKYPLSILRGETASCQVAVRSLGTIHVTAAAPGFRVTVREA